MSTLHTTLAQDSFRLYFGVIDYVIDHLKKDLQKKGKDEEEATEIVNKLQSKWKENLHKSHCIDNKNMMGFNMMDSLNQLPATNTSNTSNINPNHNANNFNPIQPPPNTSFTDLTEMPLPYIDNDQIDQGPARKKQKLNNNNNNNHNNNNNYNNNNNNNNNNNMPPPLQPPHVIQPNYPQNNPHIQGLGVPQIDQVHNPFTHPQPQSKGYNIPQNDGGNDMETDNEPQTNQTVKKKKGKLIYSKPVRFIVQCDGPSPMKPTTTDTVGFDDSDDDDEDDDIQNNQQQQQQQQQQQPSLTQTKKKKKKSDKEENDDDDDDINNNNNNNNNADNDNKENPNTNNPDAIDAEIEGRTDNEHVPHIVNGRDLNAPLCSDDDDTDDGEDLDPSDKIICQFTKVVRKKHEWTVDLKHGLMHINGKDYAFQKATGGSFSWA